MIHVYMCRMFHNHAAGVLVGLILDVTLTGGSEGKGLYWGCLRIYKRG